jgi:hypothetical protein
LCAGRARTRQRRGGDGAFDGPASSRKVRDQPAVLSVRHPKRCRGLRPCHRTPRRRGIQDAEDNTIRAVEPGALCSKKVRASLRRLLQFKDSRRENFILGSLILTTDRPKAGLPTSRSRARCRLEFRLQPVLPRSKGKMSAGQVAGLTAPRILVSRNGPGPRRTIHPRDFTARKSPFPTGTTAVAKPPSCSRPNRPSSASRSASDVVLLSRRQKPARLSVRRADSQPGFEHRPGCHGDPIRKPAGTMVAGHGTQGRPCPSVRALRQCLPGESIAAIA